MTLHVAIVGAGLGGLAAALFLRKADIDVTVYEQARELHEVGAGIVVPPQYGPSSMPGTGGSSLGPLAARFQICFESLKVGTTDCGS
jgi:glycine/D-amino acid oxidase-like deaminating enzyme